MGEAKKKQAKKRSAPAKPKRSGVPKRKGPGRERASAMVEKVLEQIEKKIGNDDLRPTVGDYLRLLQFRAELEEQEKPKEIKVTWVEPQTTESAPEE